MKNKYIYYQNFLDISDDQKIEEFEKFVTHIFNNYTYTTDSVFDNDLSSWKKYISNIGKEKLISKLKDNCYYGNLYIEIHYTSTIEIYSSFLGYGIEKYYTINNEDCIIYKKEEDMLKQMEQKIINIVNKLNNDIIQNKK